MNTIECPHCHKSFSLDDAGYADIVKQVRDREFESALHERLESAEQLKKAELETAVANAATDALKKSSELEAQLAAAKADLKAAETAKELAVQKAVSDAEKKVVKLEGELETAKVAEKTTELALKDKYESQIKDREDQIERLRDLKLKLSTKMVGETLEEHCANEFNILRAGAFPRAKFGKDNDAKSGSKGDFIFRDFNEDGVEFISTMFEMKNESDTTATKKKNEDFLKELDKDRNEKGCEYAVLVSLLEPESDLYNVGIVDVSHIYPKMYVVRPQFFIPIITLLRNAALKSVETRAELERVRAQNIDITNFENDVNASKADIEKYLELFGRQREEAVVGIDKAIKQLETVKDTILKSENNLRLANNKMMGISIRKLTKNNPTMAEKFKALEE